MVEVVSGRRYATLANDISDALARAQRSGMSIDEATSIVVQVAADFGREEYGLAFLDKLAGLVRARTKMPAGVSQTSGNIN